MNFMYALRAAWQRNGSLLCVGLVETPAAAFISVGVSPPVAVRTIVEVSPRLWA